MYIYLLSLFLAMPIAFSGSSIHRYKLQKHINDNYTLGYIDGYLASEVGIAKVNTAINNDKVYVESNVGNIECYNIAEIIYSIVNHKDVYILEGSKDVHIKNNIVTWFPASHIFQPLVADTRQPKRAVGFRFDDDVFGKRVAEVNFMANVPIVRIENSSLTAQVAVDGGVFSLFNMGEPSHGHVADLQNSDFFGGITLEFLKKDIQFRTRFYHISCHIGDDFIGAFYAIPGEKDKKIEWWNKLDAIKAHLDQRAIIEIRNMAPVLIDILNDNSLAVKSDLEKLKGPEVFDIERVYEAIDALNIKVEYAKNNILKGGDSDEKLIEEIKNSNRDLAILKAYTDNMFSWVFSNKPSYEAIDFALMYNVAVGVRIYGCMGIFIRNNPTIDQSKGYIQYGYDVRTRPKEIIKGIYYSFIHCLDVVHRDLHSWMPDATYVYALDIGKSPIFGKKLRIYLERHSGFSQEGMFKNGRSSYTGIGLRYQE